MEKNPVVKAAQEAMGLNEDGVEPSIVDQFVKLQETVKGYFNSYMSYLTEICLSGIATLLLEDVKNPTGINLEGPPSSGKTTVLSFFYDLPEIIYKSDAFTPACFVSHAANVKSSQLEKVDLLPKIRYKVLVVPELAPIFKDRQEDLLKNISYLTRVFDGEGLETDSGSKGRRGYTGDFLFAWLAATTPLDYRVWKTMGKLGSRWLFYKLVKNHENEEHKRAGLTQNLTGAKSYRDKVSECRQAAHSFLKLLWSQTEANRTRHGDGPRAVRGIVWDRSQDLEFVKPLVRVAQLVTNARSIVSVWREKDLDDKYNYSQPEIEEPDRLATILHNVARGHAIIQGRRELNEDDVKLAMDLAFNSMSNDRMRLLDFLLQNGGEAHTSDITKNLRVSKPTATVLMETFKVLGVAVETEELFGEHGIQLGQQYAWFLSDDFKNLRGKTDDEIPF